MISFDHTLGTFGALSLQPAVHILSRQTFAQPSYLTNFAVSKFPQKYKQIMVNAAGFGGNAASIIVKQP